MTILPSIFNIPLYSRLLLTKAMKTPQPPYNVSGINTYHLSAGKAGSYRIQGLIILTAQIGGNNDRCICDIKVSIGRWQSLILVNDHLRHRQLYNIKLLSIYICVAIVLEMVTKSSFFDP